MKKITTLFLLVLPLLVGAQITDYSFSSASGTYTEIITSNKLGDGVTTANYYVDPSNPTGTYTPPIKTGDGFDIGFNFTFNGNVYNKFGAYSGGWIALGSSSVSPSVNLQVNQASLPLSSISPSVTDFTCAFIAPFANAIVAQANSSLTYLTTGDPNLHNRIFTIQWKNFQKSTGGSGDSFNFQIKLYETTNVIQFVYGNFTNNSSTLTYQVGFRGSPATSVTNFSVRTSACDWTATTAGTSTSSRMLASSTCTPTSGLTYTWTPPICGSVNNFVASTYPNSANLTWGAGFPTPTGFEYIYSTSSTVPDSTTSGTATTAGTASLAGLDQNTAYYVFTRSVCGSQYGQWGLAGSFRTTCPDSPTLFENFDSYNLNVATPPIPACWIGKVTSATASVGIESGSVVPGSVPNRLKMWGSAVSGSLGTSYAILPPMSNIADGAHRLKFKAYATTNQTARTLDIGYFTDPNDINTFHLIETMNLLDGPANITEHITTPVSTFVTGAKNLAFRNAGVTATSLATYAFIDDVVWEPIPPCNDVTALSFKNLTNNSVTISWLPGSTTGWQYVIASPSVTNPYTLTGTPVPGANPTIPITGLTANTSYKVWIRSTCNTSSLGAWIGPIVFQTACAPVSELAESFDLLRSDSSSVMPSCWLQVGTTGSMSIWQGQSMSSPGSLKIDGASSDQYTIVALPPLSTTLAGDHQLRMNIKGSAAGVTLDIGYLDDITDPSTFHYINSVATTTSSFVSKTIGLGQYPKSPYLAFRNQGVNPGSVYVDDVVWEAIPPQNCPAITNLTASVNSNSAIVHWKVTGTETQWQYVLGGANDANPFLFTPLDLPATVSGTGMMSTISGLSSNTMYKVWVRSVCGTNSYNSWAGPMNIMTSCTPGTEFSENFDGGTGVPKNPVCWVTNGDPTLESLGTPNSSVPASSYSPPYVLSLTSNTAPYVVTMPAMSNTADGTHRLTFNYQSLTASAVLEVGYVMNIADPTSFVSLKSFNCTADFQIGIAELGLDPASQTLAFRNSTASSINVDGVSWDVIPGCENITNLKLINISATEIDFSWTKGSTETSWQYAVGPASALNAVGLATFDVNTSSTAAATNLTSTQALSPDTSYKVWVRSKCTETAFSNWVGPLTVKTACAPSTGFLETFDANTLPDCWTRVGTGGSFSIGTSSSEPNDGNKLQMNSGGSTDPCIIAMPPIDVTGYADHVLKFKFKGTSPGFKIQVGYVDGNYTPASFFEINEFTNPSSDVSQTYSVTIPASPISNILAFRYAGTYNSAVLVDNVSWSVPSVAPPACATNVTAVPDANCGRLATKISWDAVTGADGYLISIGTTANTANVYDSLDLGTTTNYSFLGSNNTTYYYTIKPYSSRGAATGCTQLSFTTNPVPCYCPSVPLSFGGPGNTGVTHVQLGASEFANPAVTYNDFTAKPVNLNLSGNNNLVVTLAMGLPYDTAVWIDFNDDYVLDNVSELVSTGTSAPGQKSVMNYSFEMPANATLGMHRMRIVTGRMDAISKADGTSLLNGTTLVDPCFNGYYGVTLDFNVNIVAPVANDEITGAIPLTVGNVFADKAITGTNVNATGSIVETAPACGAYNGMDVWYKATVPPGKTLTFEVNAVDGGPANMAAAVYVGTPDNLNLYACNDSSSATTSGSIDMPKIPVNWDSGSTVYLRVWANGGNATGAFKVSAYDASVVLGVDSLEEVNFSYYPNPVKDVLNLSFNQEMGDVSVTNLLGQELISKSLNANQGKVDMSGLSSGAYLVKVAVGNQTKTIKVVKE